MKSNVIQNQRRKMTAKNNMKKFLETYCYI